MIDADGVGGGVGVAVDADAAVMAVDLSLDNTRYADEMYDSILDYDLFEWFNEQNKKERKMVGISIQYAPLTILLNELLQNRSIEKKRETFMFFDSKLMNLDL